MNPFFPAPDTQSTTAGDAALDRLGVDRARLRDFCERWRIADLAVFGSVLRDDFRADSDVDVLVRWAPDVTWGLLDHARMEEELSRIFGRKTDLISRRAVERSSNALIRRSILGTAVLIHAA
jgi:uncharacterized protein